MADPNRTHWNERQKALQAALKRPSGHPEALGLCLEQHAMVHAAAMSARGLFSFEDEVWQGLSDAAARCAPPGAPHAIAWLAWHAARCEDITMNMLVAGAPQVLEDGWLERMGIGARDTGNDMDAAQLAAFYGAVDLEALRGYRLAVGRRTRAVIQALEPAALRQKVDPARIQRVKDCGAVLPGALWLTDYWAGCTIAGLLLMPATRHHFVHWNEALRIKTRAQRLSR